MFSNKSTPWGNCQSCVKIDSGIYSVSTSSHGGIAVEAGLKGELTPYTQKRAIAQDGYLWFEEDVDWALPIHDLKLYAVAALAAKVTPGDMMNAVLDTINQWHKEYAAQN